MGSEEKVLKQLNELRKQLTTQTNNNILQKHGLTEEIVEFQKPVTDTLKENNVKAEQRDQQVIKAIKEKPSSEIKSVSFKKPSANNSYLSSKIQTDEMIIFNLNGVDKIKLNKETDELEILKPDGSSEKTKNSEGLNELLFKEKIDFSKVTEKDVDDYFNIYILLQYDPGQSKRINKIREKFSDISNQFPARRFKVLHGTRVKEFPGSGLNIVPVDLTNKNALQLFQELSLLLAAKQAGNKNTLGKASIILDHLKNNGSITKKKYDKMLSSFTN